MFVGGKRPIGPCQCLHWARGPTQGKIPPRPWGESSSAWIQPRIKDATCHQQWHSISFHRAGKILKQKRTAEKTEVSKGKAAIITFSALCLTRPYFSVLTTTPNNWREGLMGQVPTSGTPFRRKKTTIKRKKRER